MFASLLKLVSAEKSNDENTNTSSYHETEDAAITKNSSISTIPKNTLPVHGQSTEPKRNSSSEQKEEANNAVEGQIALKNDHTNTSKLDTDADNLDNTTEAHPSLSNSRENLNSKTHPLLSFLKVDRNKTSKLNRDDETVGSTTETQPKLSMSEESLKSKPHPLLSSLKVDRTKTSTLDADPNFVDSVNKAESKLSTSENNLNQKPHPLLSSLKTLTSSPSVSSSRIDKQK